MLSREEPGKMETKSTINKGVFLSGLSLGATKKVASKHSSEGNAPKLINQRIHNYVELVYKSKGFEIYN